MVRECGKDLWSCGAWWSINKNTLDILGTWNTCALLMELITFHNHECKKENFTGEFYRSREKIKERINLSQMAQRTAEERLVNLGLIEIIVKGIPATNHIKLNIDEIDKVIRGEQQTRTTEPVTMSKSLDNSTEQEDTDSLLKTNGQFSENNKLYTNKENNNIYSVNSVSDGNAKGSRLIKKEIPIVEKKTVRPCLVDKNGNAKKEPKITLPKVVVITDVVRECIEYWNSKPEFVNHKLDIHSPSKLIQHCKDLINSFLNGNLVKIAIPPENFFDKDGELNGTQTVEDFKYFVDEFLYCYNNPNYLPRKNGFAISLPYFLQGSDRHDKPSGLLTYCIGERKKAFEKKILVKKPDLPKSDVKLGTKAVELFIKRFSEEFGKFEETEENTRIITDAVYMCAEKYEGNNWWGILGHAHMFKIILEENQWAKNKGLGIRYLATKHFAEQVAGFTYDPKANRPNAKKVFEQPKDNPYVKPKEEYNGWSRG